MLKFEESEGSWAVGLDGTEVGRLHIIKENIGGNAPRGGHCITFGFDIEIDSANGRGSCCYRSPIY